VSHPARRAPSIDAGKFRHRGNLRSAAQMTLRDVHRISAALLGSFLIAHIANHLLALAGVSMHLAFMKSARLVYRQRFVEPILLSCVLVQIATGAILAVRGWQRRRGFVPWLQAICGCYLMFFLLVHVGAVLYGRAALHLDTNFYFAAAGFFAPPFQWSFAPYYLLAVVAVFAHLGCALYWRVPWRLKRLAVLLPAGIGSVVSLSIILALAGVWHPVAIPAKYMATYAAFRGPAGP
jgi:succinate dehydrogenase/fumarate reductase cytochrome b subunit